MEKNNIEEIHKKACENEQVFYQDPETGLMVLTSYYLKSRGYCCGMRCRHCPYLDNDDGE